MPSKLSKKPTKFDAKSFIQVGSSLLKKNQLPQDISMNIISNTPLGIDLHFIGLARNQAEEMTTLQEAMGFLEKDIFSLDNLKEASKFEKINLLQLAQKSFKFRVEFIQSVKEMVDWDEVKTLILEKAQDSSEINTGEAGRKALMGKLEARINANYKQVKNKVTKK